MVLEGNMTKGRKKGDWTIRKERGESRGAERKQ